MLIAMTLLPAGCVSDGPVGDRGDQPTLPTGAVDHVGGELADCQIVTTDATVEPVTLTAPGMTLPGISFTPSGDRAPTDVMVLLHQTDGGGRCGWGDFGSVAALDGVASLAFDLCGYGGADCEGVDPYDPVPQVEAAVAWVRDTWPDAQITLVGASMGGTQAVASVAGGVDVDAWADVSGPPKWGPNDITALAGQVDLPGLVAVSEDTEGPERAATLKDFAASVGAEFIAAEPGHGYQLLVSRDGRLLDVGRRVIALAKGVD